MKLKRLFQTPPAPGAVVGYALVDGPADLTVYRRDDDFSGVLGLPAFESACRRLGPDAEIRINTSQSQDGPQRWICVFVTSAGQDLPDEVQIGG